MPVKRFFTPLANHKLTYVIKSNKFSPNFFKSHWYLDLWLGVNVKQIFYWWCITIKLLKKSFTNLSESKLLSQYSSAFFPSHCSRHAYASQSWNPCLLLCTHTRPSGSSYARKDFKCCEDENKNGILQGLSISIEDFDKIILIMLMKTTMFPEAFIL